MGESQQAFQLVTAGSVRDFFYRSLNEVSERRNCDASDSSKAYLVNLLTHYIRSDQLFEWHEEEGYSLRPLATIYGEAVNAPHAKHRMATLRRLGDVALFISGMFAPSLARKPVGVDYYIDMGGGAYGWLSRNIDETTAPLDSDLFRELSEKFAEFVNLLDEFAESCNLRGDRDLIALYERWLSTGDPAIAARIQEKGIAVNGVKSPIAH